MTNFKFTAHEKVSQSFFAWGSLVMQLGEGTNISPLASAPGDECASPWGGVAEGLHHTLTPHSCPSPVLSFSSSVGSKELWH